MSQFPRAGMNRIVPAAFFVLAFCLSPVALADVPAEDPGEALKPPAPKKEQTAFDKAAIRVAKDIRSDRSYPATADAVEFALYLYAVDGREADLQLADRLARRLRDEGDADVWPRQYFQLASAGGNTLGEVEQYILERTRGLQDSPPSVPPSTPVTCRTCSQGCRPPRSWMRCGWRC